MLFFIVVYVTGMVAFEFRMPQSHISFIFAVECIAVGITCLDNGAFKIFC